MKARWATNYYDSPELPIVQQTLIASWLPWKYYFVSTIKGDASTYATEVFRCNKDGIVNMNTNIHDMVNGKHLFYRESPNVSKALDAHKYAVYQFSNS